MYPNFIILTVSPTHFRFGHFAAHGLGRGFLLAVSHPRRRNAEGEAHQSPSTVKTAVPPLPRLISWWCWGKLFPAMTERTKLGWRWECPREWYPLCQQLRVLQRRRS